jgi:hypothetical protein
MQSVQSSSRRIGAPSVSVVVVLGFVLAAASVAQAVTVYSTGFENPPYTTGTLTGQDGWVPIGFVAADVQTTVVASGNQAAQFGPEAVYSRSVASLTANQIVTFEFDTRYAGTGEQIGITLYGDAGYIFNAQISNGGFAFTNSALNQSIFASGATAGTWHNMKAVLDFPAATITGYVNGNLVGTLSMPNAATTTTLASFVVANDFQNGVQAYFDNLVISTVPEPTSLGLLGLATVGLMARRRCRA